MTQDDEAAFITRLEHDNGRLRSLLEQQNAPGELRHRLRNTVAMLRSIIRNSAETPRDLQSYVGHLEDRLEALMRAQAAADAYGGVDFHTMLADELMHYDAKEGEKVYLSGPAICFQPRAGQIMALAIHELAVNAIEHGLLAEPTGKVEIAWNHEANAADTPVTLVWKESDHAIIAPPSQKGFGSEVLMRTLPYELGARTRMEFQPDGLRCTISFPLSERIGRITN